MHSSLTRREFSERLGALIAGGVLLRSQPFPPSAEPATRPATSDFAGELARIEARSGGRLGVAVHDTETGRRDGHRADERFPMCSTFKVLACAAVLARVDIGREDLGRRVRFERGDVVTYSPVTHDRAGGDGMTMAELCEAAMTRSDNTAANLILASLSGPAAVTAYARSLGDGVTRLDRTETTLDEATPGDPRDTTTPGAMAADLHALVVGDRLSGRSRGQLAAWLVANQTGGAKLRAGLPHGWRVGDRTGSGGRGTANDVAVLWPPDRGPVVATVYLTETTVSPDDRDAAIAAVARAVAAWVTATA